jgi:hypothetical protein
VQQDKEKDLREAYIQTFSSYEGKKVLDDLRNSLCVNSDFLTLNYSQEQAAHIQLGMRLAYRYIQIQLNLNK